MWAGKPPHRVWQEQSDSGAATPLPGLGGNGHRGPFLSASGGARGVQDPLQGTHPSTGEAHGQRTFESMQAMAAAVLGAVVTPHTWPGGHFTFLSRRGVGRLPTPRLTQAQGEQGPWRKWEAALDGDHAAPTSLGQGGGHAAAHWEPCSRPHRHPGHGMKARSVLLRPEVSAMGTHTGQFT